MYAFIPANSSKKPAEIEVPIIPPTRAKSSNRALKEAAVPATAIEVITTILDRLLMGGSWDLEGKEEGE